MLKISGEVFQQCSVYVGQPTAHSFARTAHSFACSALLASLARSAELIRSHARSLTRSRAHGKVIYIFGCVDFMKIRPTVCQPTVRQVLQ